MIAKHVGGTRVHIMRQGRYIMTPGRHFFPLCGEIPNGTSPLDGRAAIFFGESDVFFKLPVKINNIIT